MRGRRGLLGLLAGGALALLAGRGIAGGYADWALHEALGFQEIWRLKFETLFALRAGTFAVSTLFALVNLLAVRHSIVSLVLPSQLGGLEIAEEVPAQRLTYVALGLALALGLLFTLLPQDWSAASLAWGGLRFGELDPYLEQDLGHYVAWLPWERAVQARAMALTLAVAALVTTLYAATPSIRWTERGLYLSTWVRRHLSVLGGIVVLIIGWGWRLDRYERLSPGSGVWLDATAEAAFSAFDHRIALPYRAITAFVSIPLALVLVYSGWRGHLRSLTAMLGALIFIGPFASAVLPAIAKRPLSTADAQQRMRPYRNTSALYTRRAFGVDAIVADADKASEIPDAALGRSVSAWDPAALDALAGGVSRRDSVVALAWSAAAEGLEAVVLQRPTGGADAPWSTLRFVAPSADDAGHPFRAPALGGGRLARILVHPHAQRSVLVADARGDIAAAPFETAAQRLALAWSEQDPRLFFQEIPRPRPRLLTTRDVQERLRNTLPFLEPGPTLIPLVRGDSLYWIAELFVSAARYPLSEGVSLNGRERRYVSHAATAVVQAQTGRITVIPVDEPDPVMRTWMAKAASVFTPLAAAPEWVRRERPPAVDWMEIQAGALARVGFPGDSLGPTRRVTRPDDADADLAVGAPTFFQLDTLGTLGWALPLDIPWAGRTLGILVARGGSERRTEFIADAGPRWTTVLETLQGAADHAGFGRSLPDARRGRVQAIPTRGGAAWIQSYYEWPRDGIPRLAGVVFSRGGEAVAARTLAEALGEPRSLSTLGGDAFRTRVAQIYDAMQAALRAGDWRAYGDAWAALGRLLQRP